MNKKISGLTALATTFADTDLLEVSVDMGGGNYTSRKMTFLQLRTAFTKLQANLDVNAFEITTASNGNVIIKPNGTGAVLLGGNSTQATELRFMEDSDNGTNYVALKVAAALAASTTYTLPTTDGTTGQVLSTNGSGTLSWATAGGGLTKFTEAESTTTPNTTVYVDSLTAAGSTTNVDVAIVPKGTGAFMLDIPNNAASGGNKRGIHSIDLQNARDVADQVASGSYSTCIGLSNKATQTLAYASGCYNLASEQYTHVLGRNCTASNTNSHSFGAYCTASGDSSSSLGAQSNSSGTKSISFGNTCTANADFSSAIAQNAHVFGVQFRIAFGGGQIQTDGDSQKSLFILKQRTTGNTVTTLTANNSITPSTNNQLILSNNSAYRFKGTIIAKQSGSTNIAAWDVDGLIVRGANAASVTLNISNVTLIQNTPAWGTPTLAADTTNGGLRIQVTGAAATNIQWVATIETTEVIYA